MARTDTLGNFLTDVANAIREKGGTSELIQASDFDTAIENLPSGSAGVYSINVNVTNGTYSGATKTADGNTAIITVTPNEDYELPTSITVGGANYTYSDTTGTITLTEPQQNITITVVCNRVSTEIWYTNSTPYTTTTKSAVGFGNGRWGDDRDYASYTTGSKVNYIRIYLAQAGTGEIGVFNVSTKRIISSETVTFSGTPSTSEMQEFALANTYTLGANEIMYVGKTGTAKFYHWPGTSTSPTPPSSRFWDSLGNGTGVRITANANLLVDFGYKPD